MKQQTKGIFIHKSSYSESSLIVSFFTEGAGIQRYLFQGGKKKAAALFPCSICELTFYKRPDSELGKLTEASSVETFHQFPFSPLHGTVAFFMADIMRNVLKSEQEDRSMFRFLQDSLKQMDELEGHELALGIVYFLLRLCGELGLEPQVQDQKKRFFLPAEGTFTDLERLDTITLQGAGVELVQSLLMEEQLTEIPAISKREALDTLLSYFRVHFPSFTVDRTLEVIREVLYH